MNTFDALNIFYKEDTISDFLVSCFKDSKEFMVGFLKKANITITQDATVQIETRVGLGKSIGTPDIVILVKDRNKSNLIIIENKMGAAEGHEQTNRYESLEARERIAERFQLDANHTDYYYIFLALDTTTKPKNSAFAFLNYHIFLEGDWLLQDQTLQRLFSDFQQKLRDFYKPVKTPYESLDFSDNLDAMQRKICWQTILYETISTNPNFIFNWGEFAGAGRSNFLFLISKNNWTSSESFEEAGLATTFNIHIDTYVDLLADKNNTIKEIGIRFETQPYVPHNEIKPLPGYEEFLENKREFSKRLYQEVKKIGMQAKVRNSKLLALSIPINVNNTRETVQVIKNRVDTIEGCIDQVVADMKEEGIIK